jgi:tetratricopeptide (TPR) repeat protein
VIPRSSPQNRQQRFVGWGAMTREYDLKDVSRLLGISEGRLRRWARQGLVASRRRSRQGLAFDFQGLVALRTVKRLRSHGVSLQRIKKCVDTLRRLHPELCEPLAQARVQESSSLIMAQKNRRFTPEGQLMLNFDGGETEHLTLPTDQVGRLFLMALEKENLGEWKGAQRLYNLILAIKPDYPDALVNLGNILYRLGFPEGATAHYVKALEGDTLHPEANYNLANILEEQGNLEEAAFLYRRALKREPYFPEACFNLARVLERLGDHAGARKLWRRYLEMDPQGDWACYIHHRLQDPQEEPPDNGPMGSPEL